MDPNATPATSRFTVQLVITLLGLIALACVVGAISLTAAGKTVPGELWTLAGTTSGALGSLLVSTRVANPMPVKEVAAAVGTDPDADLA